MSGGFGARGVHVAALAGLLMAGVFILAEDAEAQSSVSQWSGTWCSSSMNLRYDYFDSFSSPGQRTFNNGYNGALTAGAHPGVAFLRETAASQARTPQGTEAPDELWRSNLPLGFTFPYFDQTYTAIAGNINGVAYLAPATTYNPMSNNALFGLSGNPNSVIAPLWTDLYAPPAGLGQTTVGTGGMYYGNTGGHYVLWWAYLQPDPDTAAPPSDPPYDFGAKLFPNGNIEFHIDYSGFWGDPDSTIGLEDPAGVAQITRIKDASGGAIWEWDNYAMRFVRVNDIAPVLMDDAYTANEAQLLSVANTGNNAYNMPGAAAGEGVMFNDKDELPCVTKTASVASGPANGVVGLNPDGSFTYTSNAGFYGTDTFTYTLADGQFTSLPATVTILVNDVPDAVDDTYTIAPDTAFTAAAPGVLANDVDNDDASLTVALVGSTTTPLGGTIALGANGAFVYTPPAGCPSTTDSFQYKVSDGKSTSNTATVTIRINCQPVGGPDSYTTTKDQPLTVALPGVLANDNDPNSDTLTALAATGSTSQGGTYALAADGSFTFNPKAGFVGSDTFTYKATDGHMQTAVTTVTITVEPPVAVNNPPVASGNTYTTGYGTALTVAAPGVLSGDTDADGDALTAVLVADVPGSAGTLDLESDGSFVFTPVGGFSGATSFTYKANDGKADSNVVTVTITVLTPQPPAKITLTKLVVGNGQTGTIGPSKLKFTDADGTPEQTGFVLSALPQYGDLYVAGQKVTATGLAFTQADIGALALTYTHNGGPEMADGFTFTVEDADGLSNGPHTFPIEILDVGDVPVAEDDEAPSWRNVEDEPIDVLANDADPNGDPLVITGVGVPKDGGGIVRGNAWTDGALVFFTPTFGAPFEGDVSFDYTISDGVNEATATVVVTVQDPATASLWMAPPASVCRDAAGTWTAVAHLAGAAPSWSWSFDGAVVAGGFGQVSMPVHTFTGTGTVTVAATATWGTASETVSTEVDVLRCEPPSSAFTCTAQGLSLAFAPPGDGIYVYRWDFGDGSGSTEAFPTHRYAEAGTYTVTLNVTDSEGSSETTKECVLPAITSGGWDTTAGPGFYQPPPRDEQAGGDGGADDGGDAEADPVVNLPPVARAGPDLYAGGLIYLDGSASFDPEGMPLRYAWSQVSGPRVDLHEASYEHPWFTAPDGSYVFRLTVSDGEFSDWDDVMVEVAVTEIAWSAHVDGAKAMFQADAPAGTYHWEFGDGATSSLADPTHTYGAPGKYVVRLVVTADGQQWESVRTVTVDSAPGPPVAGEQGHDAPASAADRDFPLVPAIVLAGLVLLVVVVVAVAVSAVRPRP